MEKRIRNWSLVIIGVMMISTGLNLMAQETTQARVERLENQMALDKGELKHELSVLNDNLNNVGAELVAVKLKLHEMDESVFEKAWEGTKHVSVAVWHGTKNVANNTWEFVSAPFRN